MTQIGIESERTYIRRMLPRHFQILDMTLAGHQGVVIAEAVGMSAQAVKKVQASPLFQAELVRARRESKDEVIMSLDRQAIMGKAKSILEEASVAAAMTHEELLESKDDSIKLRAASAILDRVFGKNSDHTGASVVNISAEQVNLLTIALKESSNVRNSVSPADSPSASDPQTQRCLEGHVEGQGS